MTKDEAAQFLVETRKMYQPIPDFPNVTDRAIAPFYKRIKSIADYCGSDNYYLVCGCANGYSCFELARLGAKVLGVDMRDKWLDVARATAIYHDFPADNPKFIHGLFPAWLDETTERPDWTVMMMVLHNMLKFSTLVEICRMIDRVAEITAKGFIITTRGRHWCRDGVHMSYGDIPNYITKHTNYNRWEEVPCPRNVKGKRDIAFGFPIWSFFL